MHATSRSQFSCIKSKRLHCIVLNVSEYFRLALVFGSLMRNASLGEMFASIGVSG